MKIIDLVNN